MDSRNGLPEATYGQFFQEEGKPEPEFHEGIAQRMPVKNLASGALIRDVQGRILFIVPTYKPFLDIPGGVAEENESPLAACRREVSEELGIDLPITRLLLVDWVPQHGTWRDSTQFVFDGGVMSQVDVAQLKLAGDEVAEICFLSLDEAKPRLRPSMLRRMTLAQRALTEGIQYCEFGSTDGLGGTEHRS